MTICMIALATIIRMQTPRMVRLAVRHNSFLNFISFVVPPPKPARSSITLDDWGEEDELDGIDNSSSRARMLAQQRDLQLKKRQSAAQSNGMVRSSLDAKQSSPVRMGDEQFTPAVRQFSAPKTLRDLDDDNDFDTEFNHKPAIKVLLQTLLF